MAMLEEFLAQLPADEVERAIQEGSLPILVLERTLQSAEPLYDLPTLAEKAGIDPADMVQLWRAMGFPDPAPGTLVAGAEDVAITAIAKEDMADPARKERVLHQLRVFSSSLARMAEVSADDLSDEIAAMGSAGLSDREIGEALLERIGMRDIQHLLFHLYRLQLLAAMRRRLAAADPTSLEQPLAVGFVDMVDFTAVSQELEAGELAALVDEFETRSQATVAEQGARLVKSIGDEIMYSTPDPAIAVRVALRLARDDRRGPLTPDVRAGVAYGPVVARWGDEFGPVVNLASRLLNIAYPGSVIVSDEIHEALADDPELSWRALKPRRLKGIGKVPSWVVRRADDPAE